MRNTPTLDAERLCHELTQRGEAWADANAAAEALEETRQSLYSSIAAELLATGASAAKAEMLAKADERYAQHLKAMVAARKAANRARVRYDTYKVYCEMQRSNASTERALATLR